MELTRLVGWLTIGMKMAMKIQLCTGAIYPGWLMLPFLALFLAFLLFPPLLLFLPIAFLFVIPGSFLKIFMGPRFIACPFIHPSIPRSPPL
jgi:hypothetical protein